jgi:hypothetical protein
MIIKQLVFILSLIALSNMQLLAASPTQDLKVVGQAKLKILFWDVYHSTFYSPSGQYKKEQFPQVLRLEYLRDINKEDLLDKTVDEWTQLQVQQTDINKWIVLLQNIFPDINKGDSLLIRVNENLHSEFFYNTKPIGTITDANFGQQFLRIWVDEKCSYPQVCQKLRGEG